MEDMEDMEVNRSQDWLQEEKKEYMLEYKLCFLFTQMINLYIDKKNRL